MTNGFFHQNIRAVEQETSCLGDLMRQIRDEFPTLFNASIHISTTGIEDIVATALTLAQYDPGAAKDTGNMTARPWHSVKRMTPRKQVG